MQLPVSGPPHAGTPATVYHGPPPNVMVQPGGPTPPMLSAPVQTPPHLSHQGPPHPHVTMHMPLEHVVRCDVYVDILLPPTVSLAVISLQQVAERILVSCLNMTVVYALKNLLCDSDKTDFYDWLRRLLALCPVVVSQLVQARELLIVVSAVNRSYRPSRRSWLEG
ncbi:unnamed protein product [Soboliphyme baturini]|uniref:Mediator complex subunit 23 n=1 Tax=Soboliphyme baturini TaxID=241478 RepID=A0A183J2G2_9BILA|nr:unnamed protein product [Soboliphyme baturini]